MDALTRLKIVEWGLKVKHAYSTGLPRPDLTIVFSEILDDILDLGSDGRLTFVRTVHPEIEQT